MAVFVQQIVRMAVFVQQIVKMAVFVQQIVVSDELLLRASKRNLGGPHSLL